MVQGQGTRRRGKRQGNRPDRRVAAAGSLPDDELQDLARRVRYTGSAMHKLRPGDYGLVPPLNPRPTKSPCDGIRPVKKREAGRLFAQGLKFGMVSRFSPDGAPKYVWAVDARGGVFEAKTDKRPQADGYFDYHGYRLGEDDVRMRDYILKEWKLRCPAT